jgi:hypothetical protein
MYDQVRATLIERIELGATLDEIERIILMSHGLRPDERRNLWLFAWRYAPEPEPTLH